jgi:hypothetical protein
MLANDRSTLVIVHEFYMDEENYMFIRKVTADLFMTIFMARGREKEQEKYGKSEELTSGVWGIYDRHQGVPMIRSVTLILGCCLVLILRKDDWNELTGHPEDRGKDWLNLRMNSLQPGEDNADQKIVQSSSVLVNDRTKPANDRRTCAKTSKPSVEVTDEGRLTA